MPPWPRMTCAKVAAEAGQEAGEAGVENVALAPYLGHGVEVIMLGFGAAARRGSRTSEENFVDFFMAPASQRLEPPPTPGRFNSASDEF